MRGGGSGGGLLRLPHHPGVFRGLRYASASILTFAVGFAFYDWKPMGSRWVMPAIAAAINAFTGFIVQSQPGWTSGDVIYFTLEVLLTAGAAWAFRQALGPMKRPGGGQAVRAGQPGRTAHAPVRLSHRPVPPAAL